MKYVDFLLFLLLLLLLWLLWLQLLLAEGTDLGFHVRLQLLQRGLNLVSFC